MSINRLKQNSKIIWIGLKTFVRQHPRASFCYGFSIFIFIAFFVLGTAPLLNFGIRVENGQVANTVTLSQVTGLVIILFAVDLFFFGLLMLGVFLWISKGAYAEDEHKLTSNHAQQTEEKTI